MNIKRILPIEANLIIKNIKDYVFQEKVHYLKDTDKPRCYFLDAASYDNLGDQAIALAMTYFLTDVFGEERVAVVNEIDLLRQFKSIKAEIKPKDVIALSGGGNMGDKYPRYEAIRRKVIKAFPNNRIVIFPQTIDYTNDKYGKKQLKKSVQVYRNHKNLYVCARENRSLNIMKKLYKDRVYLVPDIVFYLWEKIEFSASERKNVGICLRDDDESILTIDLKNRVRDEVSKKYCFRDISTIKTGTEKIVSMEQRYNAIYDKISEFSEFKCIITDRLHGMIFSLLSMTPCCVFDNKNHKVFGIVESWHLDKGVYKCVDYKDIDMFIDSKKKDYDKSSFDVIQYSVLNKLLFSI